MSKLSPKEAKKLINKTRRPKGGRVKKAMLPLYFYIADMPHYIPEYRWQDDLELKETGRRFRFDYAWPHLKLAVEYEGIFTRGPGGHTSIPGVSRDIEKYQMAQLKGWTICRVTAAMGESDLIDILRQYKEMLAHRAGTEGGKV